jgi:hypothetical protein
MERVADIFGTEKDKINCPFYFKIGACRHGERCSRIHVKPEFSQTLMIPGFYQKYPLGNFFFFFFFLLKLFANMC